MDRQFKRLLSLMLYFSLIAGAVILCFNRQPGFVAALVIYAPFAALMVIHNWLYFSGKLSPWANVPFIGAALALALFAQYFDQTPFTGFPVMILTAMVVMRFRPPVSVPFALAAIAASVALRYLFWEHPAGEFWPSIGTMLLPRLFLIAMFALARYTGAVSAKNRQLAESLQQKANELESALLQLQEYTEELKETAVLRARARLIQDLHDRLGHMLTTASIGSQAAAVLLDRDVAEARERIAMVTHQIQSAMQSLRDVLAGKTIDTGNHELVSGELVSLIRETEQRTGLLIEADLPGAEAYDALPLPQRSFLYNALMEGLTNGIRHGHATRFEFSLLEEGGEIRLRLCNNGRGFQKLTYGHGLSKIERDALRFGGLLKMDGSKGCTLSITLPIAPDSSEGLANG